MRPTARPQSALRAPLNSALATEAHVRMLRVLATLDAPITGAELARRAELQPSSVHRALKSLEKTGVITFVGAGPRNSVALSDRSPLTKPMRALFAAERARYDELLDTLKRVASGVRPPPVSVWIQGPVARGTDIAGDAVTVCVLGSAREVSESAERIREGVQRIERKLDVTVEVRTMTTADLEALPLDSDNELSDAIAVLGIPPMELRAHRQRSAKTRRITSHADHDTRLLTRGRQIADALRQDPTLVTRARTYVRTRMRQASPRERMDLKEWQRILDSATPARLRRILTDSGERGTRLRQTLPFLDMLPHSGSRRAKP